jgi:hypothetical protein
MPTCKTCQQVLPAQDFAADRNRSSGLRADCRACAAEITRRWRIADKLARAEERRRISESPPREKIVVPLSPEISAAVPVTPAYAERLKAKGIHVDFDERAREAKRKQVRDAKRARGEI